MKKEILNFLDMTEHCWSKLGELAQTAHREELFNNWLEFHWEVLVEWPLREQDPDLVLECYGEGAETQSSRIFDGNRTLSHRVSCVPLTGNSLTELVTLRNIEFPPEGLPLQQFVACSEGQWYCTSPPFNAVLLYLLHDEAIEQPLVFALAEIDFKLMAT